MCEVLDKAEKRGEKRGENRSARKIAINLYRMGMPPERIAEAVEHDAELVRQWVGAPTPAKPPFAPDPERDEYYELFFQLCRKYKIDWPMASPKEKAFIEEVLRVTWEKRLERRTGVKRDIRPAFSE